MIRYDSCARPTYPKHELEQDLDGTVTLLFLVGADGKVKKSRVAKSSGYSSLDEAALGAISRCSFHPPVADGKRDDAWIHFQYVWKHEPK